MHTSDRMTLAEFPEVCKLNDSANNPSRCKQTILLYEFASLHVYSCLNERGNRDIVLMHHSSAVQCIPDIAFHLQDILILILDLELTYLKIVISFAVREYDLCGITLAVLLASTATSCQLYLTWRLTCNLVHQHHSVGQPPSQYGR